MTSFVFAAVLIALWFAWKARPRARSEPVHGVADEAEEVILAEIRRACEDGTMVLTREIMEGR